MISGKVRKIVRNPNKYTGSVGATNKFMRAHEHIQENYKAHGSPANPTNRRASWLPPIRDLDRKARPAKLAIEIYTQRRGMKYAQIFGIDKVGDAKTVAQLMMPKQYNITRRGLARSSWGWMLRQLKKTASTEQPEINGTVMISRSNISVAGKDNIIIEATNKLNYIRKATKANISTVLARASRMMIDEIEGHTKGAAARAGLRAA
jgi:hypothetical protein